MIIGQVAIGRLHQPGKFEGNGGIMANDNQKAGRLDPASPVTDPIGLALQRLHDEVAKEDIPDAFLNLLNALDAGTVSNSTTQSSATQSPVSGFGA